MPPVELPAALAAVAVSAAPWASARLLAFLDGRHTRRTVNERRIRSRVHNPTT